MSYFSNQPRENYKMDVKTMKQHFKKTLSGMTVAIALAMTPAAAVVTNAPTSAEAATAATVQLKAGKGTFIRLGRDAGAVFVADPDIADVDIKFSNMLYIYGAKPGETTVHAIDEKGNVILSRTILVIANIQELQSSLIKLIPEHEIEVYSANNKMILKGTVPNAAIADRALKIAGSFVENEEDVINMINVNESSQVTVSVKIAEVQRNIAEQIGVDFQAGTDSIGNFRFGSFGSNGIISLPDPDTGSQIFNIGGQNPVNVPGTQYSQLLGLGTGSTTIEALIKALEERNVATVLAEPNLTAISGETASFLAGGEFPILVPQQNQVTIEFKEFGVGLNFSPLVLPGNRIRLKVNPTVSELSDEGAVELDGIVVPALKTRKAETTVEMGSGESFVMAGLLQNNLQDNIKAFPWLADLPILGPLFRSTSYQREDSELMIVATPYIVEPIKQSQSIKLPTDNVYMPNLKDRWLHGQDSTTTLEPKAEGNYRLMGPSGFFTN